MNIRYEICSTSETRETAIGSPPPYLSSKPSEDWALGTLQVAYILGLASSVRF